MYGGFAATTSYRFDSNSNNRTPFPAFCEKKAFTRSAASASAVKWSASRSMTPSFHASQSSSVIFPAKLV